MEHDQANNVPKFTRGEKCIFFHLVLVFSATLILLIIFILHLYSVAHSEHSAMNTRRAGSDDKSARKKDYPPIGAVYIDTVSGVMVCNSLLLNSKWSVSPANCVVTRSHPDMAFLLMTWRILYKDHNSYITKIQRSIAHSHFDKDTLSNNIGLFEHTDDIPLPQYAYTRSGFLWNEKNMNNLKIINNNKNKEADDTFQVHKASLLPLEDCAKYTSPVVDLRSYEFCVVPEEQNISLEYGALVLLNRQIMGFYSWGERNRKHLPFIFLNITQFHEWLKTIFYVM